MNGTIALLEIEYAERIIPFYLFSILLIMGIATAANVTCVPFTGTSSISSGAVVVDIYTDNACTASVFTGGFTYAGKSWQVTLGNCTGTSSLNLTEYETYYYRYLVNGIATSDSVCHSFVATNPTNGTTNINNYVSGANITYVNYTNNITNNYTTLANGSKACAAGTALQNVSYNSTGAYGDCISLTGVAETDPIYTGENATIVRTQSSGACTYGISNFTLSQTTGTVTCAPTPLTYNNGTSNLTLAEVAGSIGNWTNDKGSYATTALVATINNLSYTQIAANIGNWTTDKPNYATTALVGTLNNLSATQVAGMITNATIIRSNNVSWIQTNQLTYQNGSSNLTLADIATNIANTTIIRSGNVSWIQANQLTYQNGSSNLTLTQVAGSVGNWSSDKSSYTTTANLPVYNNGTSNLTLAQVAASLGNWSGNASSVATIASVAANLGNWSGNASSYWTSAQTATLGNWSGNISLYTKTADLPVYNNGTSNLTLAQVAGSIGNWTSDKSSYTTTANLPVYNNGTSNLTLSEVATNIGNSTIAHTGACTGQFVTATTTTGVTCGTPDGSGNVSDDGSVSGWAWFKSTGVIGGNATIAFSYITGAPVYNNGTSNLTLAQVATDIANSTIIRSGNTSWVQASQLTYQNGSSNLTLAQVAGSIGNWSENQSSYATTAYANTLGNWSGNQSSYTTQAWALTLGNWSGNASSYATLANTAANIGNWSGNISSYSTKAVADVLYGGNSTAGLVTCAANQVVKTIGATSTCTALVAANLSDVALAGTCSANQWMFKTTNAAVTCQQPAMANLSDGASYATLAATALNIGNWTGNTSNVPKLDTHNTFTKTNAMTQLNLTTNGLVTNYTTNGCTVTANSTGLYFTC